MLLAAIGWAGGACAEGGTTFTCSIGFVRTGNLRRGNGHALSIWIGWLRWLFRRRGGQSCQWPHVRRGRGWERQDRRWRRHDQGTTRTTRRRCGGFVTPRTLSDRLDLRRRTWWGLAHDGRQDPRTRPHSSRSCSPPPVPNSTPANWPWALKIGPPESPCRAEVRQFDHFHGPIGAGGHILGTASRSRPIPCRCRNRQW